MVGQRTLELEPGQVLLMFSIVDPVCVTQTCCSTVWQREGATGAVSRVLHVERFTEPPAAVEATQHQRGVFTHFL